MRMVSFLMAGGGGRRVHINPEQVVCLVDMGEDRTQVVTTGLSGSTSMSLVVEGTLEDIARTLQARAAPPRSRAADRGEPVPTSRTVPVLAAYSESPEVP